LQPEKNQIYVNSGPLEFRNGDERVRGYMWLSIPWKRNTGDIDLFLQIGAQQLNTSLYQKYTPAVVPPSLLNWLEQSVGAKNTGIATEAGFVYRGTLNTKNSMARTYQLYLDIDNADLNYHPGWPALTGLDGRLLVRDARVSASVTDAGIYSSRVKRAEIRVNPRPEGRGSLLEVEGEISGAASDGIRVLREGMLRQYLGGSMDSWFMLGDMQARLNLAIPIGTGEEKAAGARQQVDVELKVPRGIPRKGGDTAVGTNPKIIEDATEATRALGPFTIGLPLNPHSRCCHDFFLGKQLLGPIKEIGEDEWTVLHKTLHH
jgi:uncharacterized protein YhdP